MKTKIVIGLILTVLVLLVGTVWTLRQIGAERIREADRFNIPVIEQTMSQLSSWRYNDLKPYLNKKFINALSSKEFQNELDELSILGEVLTYKNIRHVGHTRYKHWVYGQCAMNKYSVTTQFDKGKGVVIFNLNHCFEKADITFFQVHSKELPTKSPAIE